MNFSIIIPCFNRHDELKAALDSCINQTFKNFEIIVIDDHSVLPLSSVCESFSDNRIRYHRNDVNLGVSGSRNVGLVLARSEYVAFLDSDDIYLPGRLECLEQMIATAPQMPDVIFSRQMRITSPDDPGMIIPRRLLHPMERLDEYVLFEGHFLQTNCYVVRTNIARSVGFDVDCHLYEDTKFILECWMQGGIVVATEEVLGIYNDCGAGARLSRQKTSERMGPMLKFAQQRCSKRARLGFEAFACGELSFSKEPAHIALTIFRAWRAGAPVSRCVIFLLRSIAGSDKIDSGINSLRTGLLANARKQLNRFRKMSAA